MFNNLRRQCFLGLKRFSPTSLKLSHSDSAVVEKKPKIKALAEDDCNRIFKREFKEDFIERLFINKFHERVLEYPELETIEEYCILQRQGMAAQKLISDESNDVKALPEVDSKSAVSVLKRHELTAFKVPRFKNGFGYLSSEYTYMQEALALDPSLAKTICEQEDFGIYLIDNFGSDVQKEQYLGKLTSGENIACFANIEKEPSVSFMPDSLKTSALLSEDNQSYTISGTKCWVYNANCADLFILSAAVPTDGGKESKLTLFLVDKNTPGVEIHEPIKTIGLKNLSICDVTFNNVVVPKTSVLGQLFGGQEVINKALTQGKLYNGGHYIAIMRKILNKVIQHCIHNEFFNKAKHEVDYFRAKMANMASRLYVVESMTYLLTGRLDNFHNSNVFLESLILKIYASEAIQFIFQQAVEILGPDFFLKDDELVELSKDSQFYVACDDANDSLRLIVASAGVKYSMKYHKERSFLQTLFDTFNVQEYKKYPSPTREIVFYKEILQGYLHGMFFQESCLLEDAIYRLYEVTKFLIYEYKNEFSERVTELKYLADMVIEIYAMSATLGRASRAYCLGVKLQDVDRTITEAEVRSASLRARQAAHNIRRLRYVPKYSEIATSTTNCNKYSDFCPVVKNLTIRKR